MGESQGRGRHRRALRRRHLAAGAAALLAVATVTALVPAHPAHATGPGTTLIGYPGASHSSMPGWPTQLLESPDGSLIFATMDNEKVVEFSTATRSIVRTITLPEEVSHLALTPSGALDALTVNPDQSNSPHAVYVIDPTTGRFVSSPLPSGFEPYGFAVSGDGQVAAALTTTTDPANGDSALRVAFLNPETGAPGATAYVDGPFAAGAVFSPDGRTLYAFDTSRVVAGERHNGITPIDVSTLAVSPTIELTGSGIAGVVITPDGSRIFAANFTADGTSRLAPVDVIDTATDTITDTLSAPDDGLASLQFAGDGTSVVASSGERTLVIDVGDLATRDLIGGEAEVVPGSDHVVTGLDGGTEYDASTGAILRRFGVATDYGRLDGVLSPDDRDAYFPSATSTGGGGIGHLDMAVGDQSIETTRFSGSDLLGTDSAVVDAMNWWNRQGTSTAYIASDKSFTDALSAATAAIHQKALMLLTDPGSLSPAIAKQISGSAVTKVVVVGSTDSVSNAVLTQIRHAMRNRGSVVRITGTDRYATSRALVKNSFGSKLSHVWIATGASPEDALASATAAGYKGQPLLVVSGAAAKLDSATWAFLVTEHASSFTVVGSTADVSSGVASSLAKIGTVTRISGTDAVATSLAVNDSTYPSSTTGAVLVNSTSWQDQLIGAQLAGTVKLPLQLVTTTCVPDSFAERLIGTGQGGALLIGGTPVLSADVASLAAC